MAVMRDDAVPTRADFPASRAIPTRWHDNDHYGHVNNVVYYAWFDTAVNGWLLEHSPSDVRNLPAIGLVVETGCRYLRPVSFPETVEVGLAVERLGRSSITYRLAVFAGGHDEAAAMGRFVHVYVDRESGASTDVPAVIRDAVAPLLR